MDNGVNSIFMGVGGSFDVLSGHIQRAHFGCRNQTWSGCSELLMNQSVSLNDTL